MTDDRNRQRAELRLDPAVLAAAKEAAYQARQSLNAWMAEAVVEKLAGGSAPG